MADDILFLCHRMPYPPDKGDKIRAHAILAHLAKRRQNHLACLVDDPADMAHAPYLRAMLGGECLFVPLRKRRALLRAACGALLGRSLSQGYFHDRTIRPWIKSLLQRRSVSQAVVFGSAMAPYVINHGPLSASRCVLDMVDVDSDKWAQYARTHVPPRSWLYRWEARQLARLERLAALSFGATTLVSPHEAGTLTAMMPETAARIHSVANGVDLNYFDSHPQRLFPQDQEVIVMTGRMDYWPNIQGAQWFAEQVMPLIAEKRPRAVFYVVGACPPAGFLEGIPRVVVTGRVPDVRPFLAHADVVVAPLFVARGVQNKVLEAMAMRRPVVASSAAVRALDVTSGRELLVADQAASFAEAVLRASQPQLGQQLGTEGRLYVERHHDWGRSLKRFDELLDVLGHEEATAVRTWESRPSLQVLEAP